ncbi:MAG: SRPBCC domain-containing protein, partial [Candidatus Micrarchaeota archaeon]|nr:SRPBCC domain-containing protein [Candidatus Micrarchaeota archaeon]
VVPYERFTFTAGALDDQQGILLENRQTVTLEDVDGKTKMTLHVVVTMVTKNAGQAIAGMSAGFNQQIEKLGEFLMNKS